jgi:hypothetical protein
MGYSLCTYKYVEERKRGKYMRTLAHLASPIYTCSRYGNSDISTTTKTPTHLVFAAFAAAPLRLLHPVRERASVIGSADLQNCRP